MRQLPETECSMSRRGPCQLVDAPARRTFQPFYVRDAQQGGQNAANPVDQIAAGFPVVVSSSIKRFSPLCRTVANPHAFNRTVEPNTVKRAADIAFLVS